MRHRSIVMEAFEIAALSPVESEDWNKSLGRAICRWSIELIWLMRLEMWVTAGVKSQMARGSRQAIAARNVY